MELNDLHIGGCTSVQFNPENAAEILSLGRDSQLKLVDVRNRAILHTFQHADFRIDLNYASSSLSPDGTTHRFQFCFLYLQNDLDLEKKNVRFFNYVHR